MLRRVRGLILAIALVFALTAPIAAQEEQEPRVYFPGLVRFTPTAFHETIYGMMEKCTKVSGDFEGLHWYVAASIWRSDGAEFWGMWHDEWGFPAIVLDRQKAFDGETVSHEVIHDLYEGQGPMDTYRMCVLEWRNLTPTEDDPHVRPGSSP